MDFVNMTVSTPVDQFYDDEAAFVASCKSGGPGSVGHVDFSFEETYFIGTVKAKVTGGWKVLWAFDGGTSTWTGANVMDFLAADSEG